MYCVATPMYACSTTVPSSEFGSPSPSSIFSGRMPTATSPERPSSASRGPAPRCPSSSRTVSGPLTVPADQVRHAEEARDERRRGLSYSSVGVPSCSIRPLFMTAIWSAIVIASSWSCVTWMNVMPTSCWIALQLELHLLAQLQVERAERLVEKQHLRLVDERARERDALLLAAGELARLPLLQPARPTSSSISLDAPAQHRRRARSCGAGRTRRSRRSRGAGRARTTGRPC